MGASTSELRRAAQQGARPAASMQLHSVLDGLAVDPEVEAVAMRVHPDVLAACTVARSVDWGFEKALQSAGVPPEGKGTGTEGQEVRKEEGSGHGDQLVLPPDSIRLPRSRTGRALLTGLPASHGDLLAACASVWRCALDLGLDLGPEAWEDTALALSRGGASAEDIDWVRRAAPDGAWRSGRLARALARA